MRSPVSAAGGAVVAGFLVLALVLVVVLLDRPDGIAGQAVPVGAAPATGSSAPFGGPDPGAANVRVGDCVMLNDRDQHTLASPVDCAAPDAVYQVGYRNDQGATGTCPTESYDRYVQRGPSGEFMLCLMMNGEKGDCFAGYTTDNEPKSKVDCSQADAVVTARLDGRVDPSICPPSSRWRLLYPEPGRTLCLDPLP